MTAALDYAKPNVRVNAVCPGVTDAPTVERFGGGTSAGRKQMIAIEPVERMTALGGHADVTQ